MTTLRRRLLATSTATLAALALGACGTSFNAQTNQQYQAAEGANLNGEVDVKNAVLVVAEDGSATVSAGIVSQLDEAEAITNVTVDGPDGPLDVVRLARSVLQLPAKDIVTLGSSRENAFTVQDAGDIAGRYVTLTISFDSSPDVTIDAPAVERSATYDSVFEGTAEVTPAS